MGYVPLRQEKLHGNRARLENCVSNIIARLRKENAFYGDDIAIDSTDLPAWANVNRPGDKDARWGFRTASRSKKSKLFLSYKLHMAVYTETELPIAWEVIPANKADSDRADSILGKICERGFRPLTAAMDKGYDSERVHLSCLGRGTQPVIPARASRCAKGVGWSPAIPSDPKRFAVLCNKRGAVEREFSLLKRIFALTRNQVQGHWWVSLSAELSILARLAVALR